MSNTENRGRGRGRRLYKQNPDISSPALARSNVPPLNSQTEIAKPRSPINTQNNTSDTHKCENPPDEIREDLSVGVPLPDVPDPEAYLHVRITEVIDPGNFYAMVSLKDHFDKFDLMTRELIETCDSAENKNITCPRRDDVIGVNTSMIENFGLEYKWVRGRVIRIHSEEIIEVLLLDFGSTLLVKLSDICTSLSETHKRTHSLSRHCYITDCQSIQQSWTGQACDFFNYLVFQCSPFIRAAAFTGYLLKNTFIGLNLYGFDRKEKRWISFGRSLIQAGHAVTYNNPSLTSYKQPTPLPISSDLSSQGQASAYTNTYSNTFYTSGYLPMTTPLLEYSAPPLEQGPIPNTDQELDVLQHLNDNSADFQQHFMDALLSSRKVRSLESVTTYDEFVPRVHPLDRTNAESGVEAVEEVGTTELEASSKVEKSTDQQAEFEASDMQFGPIQPPPSTERAERDSPKTQFTPSTPPTLSFPLPPGSKSPRSMGRGQMIRLNMERARLTDSEHASPVSQLSMQIAQITVTPESSHSSLPPTTDTTAVSVGPDASNNNAENDIFYAPTQLEASNTPAITDNELIQPNPTEQNDVTSKSNEASSHHSDAELVDYVEEFEESFGYSKSGSASKHSRNRSRRSPVHWKRGGHTDRKHRPPLPSSKDPRTPPIPLASKYAKSVTSQVHANTPPSIQETEIAHMKLMLAMKLDELLANFREETQKQFPDHLMKLMNDHLANNITTILGPTGPFSILLNCIFQRSIEHPKFLPISFMVLSRLYSMYRQSMTETFTHVFISTENALLAMMTSDEDATQYTHNYCQMISAYIEFILSKDLNPALMHLVESTILKFLLNFAGSDLELPVENTSNYQIKSDCLYAILEKSGRVLLNLKTECFSEIKQTIETNISQLQSMPLTLYNNYTRCLQLLDEIISAGKEAPSGLTNLPPTPQTIEHLQYPNQGYKQTAPTYQQYQQDPRACLQQNTQPQYIMQSYYQNPAPVYQNYMHPQYDANVYHQIPQQQPQIIPVNQTQQMQVPPQQYQQPILQSQSSVETIHSPNMPIMTYPNQDPFSKIRKMLSDLQEPDQTIIQKFENARIQDDLLTASWDDLESVLKDTEIPRGLILRIKRYLHPQQQFKYIQPSTGYSMVPQPMPMYQPTEHSNQVAFQQQVVDPAYGYSTPQVVQAQVINPNANSNNNSNTNYPPTQQFSYAPRFPAQSLQPVTAIAPLVTPTVRNETFTFPPAQNS